MTTLKESEQFFLNFGLMVRANGCMSVFTQNIHSKMFVMEEFEKLIY